MPTSMAIFAGVGVLIGMLSARILAPYQGAVVERLGRFHRLLGPGLNWLVPGVDRLRKLPQLSRRGVIECREMTLAFNFSHPPQVAAVGWHLQGHLWFCLDDVAAAVYAPQPLLEQLQRVAQSQLFGLLANTDPARIVTLQWLAQWQSRIDPVYTRWGVRLVRITMVQCVCVQACPEPVGCACNTGCERASCGLSSSVPAAA